MCIGTGRTVLVSLMRVFDSVHVQNSHSHISPSKFGLKGREKLEALLQQPGFKLVVCVCVCHLAAFTGVDSVVVSRGTVGTHSALQVEGGGRQLLLTCRRPKHHRGRTGRWR